MQKNEEKAPKKPPKQQYRPNDHDKTLKQKALEWEARKAFERYNDLKR